MGASSSIRRPPGLGRDPRADRRRFRCRRTPASSRIRYGPPCAASFRHGVMGGGRGVADQRFRAAKADREAQQTQPVEEAEGAGLAAGHVEGEGRARPRALAVIDGAGGRALGEEAEIGDPGDLRVVAQEGRDRPRIPNGAFGPQAHGLDRAQQHPAAMRVGVTAEHGAQLLQAAHQRRRAAHRTRHEVAVPAGIFR